jgi:hypothetical protein
MEVIENALGSIGSGAIEAELERDSSVIISVVPREQRMLGALLSRADGGPSALFRVLQLLVATLAVVGGATTAQNNVAAAGMERPNELLELFGLLTGVAYGLLILPLGSARVALQPGGPLERLGAGTQLISQADARSLARWRVPLRVVTVLFFLPGLIAVSTSIGGVDGMTGVELPVAVRLYRANFGLCCFLVVPILFTGWWASMSTASCLCRVSITDVIKQVRQIDPPLLGTESREGEGEGEGAWEKGVAAPAQQLRLRLEQLSDGWSGGLLGMSGFLGVFSLGMFMLAINAEYCAGVDRLTGDAPGTYKHILLFLTGLFGTLALLLAKDLATTSSRCELLIDEINSARMKHGPASYINLSWLIDSLKELVSDKHAGTLHGTGGAPTELVHSLPPAWLAGWLVAAAPACQ